MKIGEQYIYGMAREKAPTPENPEIAQALKAVQEFAASCPAELSNEDWAQVFEQLKNIPGSGGPHVIASQAARIVEAYQEKYKIPLIEPM